MSSFADWGWFGEKDGQPSDSVEQPMPPDGRHTGEIVKSVVRDVKFKVSDDNPSGTSLCVDVAIGQYRLVESIVPLQMRGLIEAICRSARVHLPDKNTSPRDLAKSLEGKTVSLETVHGIGKTGREYVRVEKWIRGADPLPQEVASRPPAARSQSAKAHKEVTEHDPDAIPF